MVRKLIEGDDHVKAIKFAINEDRVDILNLIFIKSGYYTTPTIYGWYSKNRDHVIPLHYAIVKDSLKCFQYLYDLSEKDDEEIIDDAFLHCAHKILGYMNSLQIKHSDDNRLKIIKKGCSQCYHLSNFSNFFDFLYNSLRNYEITINRYNAAFHFLVKSLPYERILFYKNQACEQNRIEICKLLTEYTSPFSKFNKIF